MFKLSDEKQALFENMTTGLVTNGFMAMNLDVVASFYHQDDAFRFADADGPFHKGWKEYSVWLGKIFGGLVDKQKFGLRDTYSYQVDSEVVITTTFIDNKTRLSNGKVIEGAMRLTFVWLKTDEGWKIVHEHFSKHSGELADVLGYPDTGKREVDFDE